MFSAEVKSRKDEDICILVRVENHSYNYICECGEASGLTVKECQNTNAIFISHTHIDHFVNFDTILRHQIGIKRRIIICGPENIINHIQSRLRSYCWNLIEEDSIIYEIREIRRDGTVIRAELKPPLWERVELENMENSYIYKNELFQVEFTILDHKTDSIAYLFRGRNTTKIDIQKSDFKGGKWVRELKNAFEKNDLEAIIEIDNHKFKAKELFHLMEVKYGEKLGVIMDHAASKDNHKKIIETFKDADQVFIESFYKEEDQEFAASNFHSYSLESGRIMKICNVKEAIPVHFSRKYNDNEVDQLIDEFNLAFK